MFHGEVARLITKSDMINFRQGDFGVLAYRSNEEGAIRQASTR
jgi:hypothetical protein